MIFAGDVCRAAQVVRLLTRSVGAGECPAASAAIAALAVHAAAAPAAVAGASCGEPEIDIGEAAGGRRHRDQDGSQRLGTLEVERVGDKITVHRELLAQSRPARRASICAQGGRRSTMRCVRRTSKRGLKLTAWTAPPTSASTCAPPPARARRSGAVEL